MVAKTLHREISIYTQMQSNCKCKRVEGATVTTVVQSAGCWDWRICAIIQQLFHLVAKQSSPPRIPVAAAC